MRTRELDTARGTITSLLTALMLALSVAVPLLERSDVSLEPVAESHHDPATCAPAHDHTLCTQMGGSVPAMAAASTHAMALRALSVLAGSTHAPAVTSALAEGHPTRGPPLA